VQLIHVGSGYHLWSDSYDPEMTGVFAVQEEISRAIASRLEVKLGSAPAGPLTRRGTENLDAYLACLEARHYTLQLTSGSMARGLACYQNIFPRTEICCAAYVVVASIWQGIYPIPAGWIAGLVKSTANRRSAWTAKHVRDHGRRRRCMHHP
jgi:adenylate cyclase